MDIQHPQDAARDRIRATTSAVAFAEDAFFNAAREYMAGLISVRAYEEVSAARLRVRRIAAIGTRSVESP